ncbi:MAG: DUF1801 domain-containing protein [Devosia sp.]
MPKLSEVDAWLAKYDNPMKAVVEAVRDTVLAADKRIGETIKWQAPTFVYKGNMASFFPKSKSHAALMFHKGSTIPGEFPSLEGDGKEGRIMRFASLAEVKAKRKELAAVTQAWCDLMDGQ